VRATAFLTILGLSIALGALITLLSLLSAGGTTSPLADPNLRRALMEPAAMDMATLVLAGCILALVAGRKWPQVHAFDCLAIIATASAALSRGHRLPKLFTTWSTVDLVLQRPTDRFLTGQGLAQQQTYVLWTAFAVLIAMTWLLCGHLRMPQKNDAAGVPGEDASTAHAGDLKMAV
jgi:hypothetical protein